MQPLSLIHIYCLPFMPETYRYVKQHRTEYDLIITSEVFSLNSLMAYRAAPDKTIIWHELAKHNAIMKKIPSKIWYGVIARLFMRNAKVVARSVEARNFVKKYCVNTDVNVIDHGVNLDKFKASTEKDKDVYKRQEYYKDFVVTAQHGVILGACLVLYLFMLQEGHEYSRLCLLYTSHLHRAGAICAHPTA